MTFLYRLTQAIRATSPSLTPEASAESILTHLKINGRTLSTPVPSTAKSPIFNPTVRRTACPAP